MVLGVCRRVLRDPDDAEDAFQATFLVLVRRASSVVPRDAVGNWLYGVARRTALKARQVAARRRVKEREAVAVPRDECRADDTWGELRPVLDEELDRLSDKYRLPVVLCDLEGRGRREVARLLGVPEETLSSRLATARRTLAGRLSRRGLTLSTGALAAVVSQNAAPTCLPARLIGLAIEVAGPVTGGPAVEAVPASVTALADEIVREMVMSKVKGAALGLHLVAAGLGGSGWAYQARADDRTNPKAVAESKGREDDRGNPGSDGRAADPAVEKRADMADEIARLKAEVDWLRARLARRADQERARRQAARDLAEDRARREADPEALDRATEEKARRQGDRKAREPGKEAQPPR